MFISARHLLRALQKFTGETLCHGTTLGFSGVDADPHEKSNTREEKGERGDQDKRETQGIKCLVRLGPGDSDL